MDTTVGGETEREGGREGEGGREKEGGREGGREEGGRREGGGERKRYHNYNNYYINMNILKQHNHYNRATLYTDQQKKFLISVTCTWYMYKCTMYK